MEKNISLREAVMRDAVLPGRYSDRELQRLGNFLSCRVRLRGYADQEVLVRWTIYDAERKQELQGQEFTQVPLKLTPETQDHSGLEHVWVPLPNLTGTFFIKITLEDHRSVVLDERDSEAFDVVPME
jgi:hypothetical protein